MPTGDVEMKAKHLTLTLTIALLTFTCGACFVLAQPASKFATQEYGSPTAPSLAQNGGFDLNTCQRECRLRFGLEPQSEIEELRRGSGTGSYYEYANCIAGCNSQFWKEFDKNIDNLERMR
jgi:hypothetical protein